MRVRTANFRTIYCTFKRVENGRENFFERSTACGVGERTRYSAASFRNAVHSTRRIPKSTRHVHLPVVIAKVGKGKYVHRIPLVAILRAKNRSRSRRRFPFGDVAVTRFQEDILVGDKTKFNLIVIAVGQIKRSQIVYREVCLHVGRGKANGDTHCNLAFHNTVNRRPNRSFTPNAFFRNCANFGVVCNSRYTRIRAICIQVIFKQALQRGSGVGLFTIRFVAVNGFDVHRPGAVSVLGVVCVQPVTTSIVSSTAISNVEMAAVFKLHCHIQIGIFADIQRLVKAV